MSPAEFKTLWAATTAHHQAGRLPEAEQGYRKVLVEMPRHFDARHMLGVVTLQAGRLDDAAAHLAEALAIDPKSAAAHNNLGNVHLRRNQLGPARASFERAIELQPGYGDAHFNLAQVLRREGRLADALPHLHRAAAGNARSAQVHNMLGAALREQGDLAGAAKSFERAIALQPGLVDAHSNLGSVLAGQGQLKRAEDVLQRALALDPKRHGALSNLGTVLVRLGRLDEAVARFRQVLTLQPQSAEALSNLGGALREAGQLDEAIEHLRRATSIDPALAVAQINLAQALADKGDGAARAQLSRMLDQPAQTGAAHALEGALCLEREDFEGARVAYDQAVQAALADAAAHLGLGHALMGLGRAEEARASYQHAVDADPTFGSARWALAMAQIDPIADDAASIEPSRRKFARAVTELDRWFDPGRSAEGYKSVGSTQPFYLAYHPQGNRELLAPYGRLCARLMEPWRVAQGIARPKVRAMDGAPLRVGIASAHIRDHSVWNAIVKGWVRGLDPQRFAIHLYQLGSRSDAETEWAKRHVAQFEGGRRTMMQWARTIVGHQLDVLIYPEIGMDAMTVKLASLRLAPVQAASWGHPQTTGLPTIDAYLSADDLEPPAADAHYTERLVRLAHLGVCVEPSTHAPIAPDLAAMGLPSDAPLLLCPGLPFKYSPVHDRLWVEIARRAPQARLVFFRSRGSALADQLAARLCRRFEQESLAFERHVTFIPFLDRAQFFGLMRRASLFLDTVGFSGFNTALQAIECDLPVLTVEGPFLRGRLASGLLRRMGLAELVAADEGDFVERAARLAMDPMEQQRLRGELRARRGMLFRDADPLRELERFLSEASTADRH